MFSSISLWVNLHYLITNRLNSFYIFSVINRIYAFKFINSLTCIPLDTFHKLACILITIYFGIFSNFYCNGSFDSLSVYTYVAKFLNTRGFSVYLFIFLPHTLSDLIPLKFIQQPQIWWILWNVLCSLVNNVHLLSQYSIYVKLEQAGKKDIKI